MFNAFSVDFQTLTDHMGHKIHPFVIHGNEAFDHIVSELYKVPEEIKLN